MGYSIRLANILKEISLNSFKAVQLLLNDRKNMGLTEHERDVINNVIDRIADGERVDKEKLIEEQANKINDLEEKLFLQKFLLIDDESQNKVREILKENERLKAEVASLNDMIQLIKNDDPADERMRLVKVSVIQQLVAENNRLKRENEEINNLANLGQKMIEQQKKGRSKRKDIKDSEIKRLLALGFNAHQIYKDYNNRGIKCSFQAIRNRIEKMKKEGVIT
ncbi:hypothetical protein [Ruminiclostridium josui]|uniref:hypothetical protein n=1 Tax=Ruminiclostridium josui TaxID=1499 RepID=UPI0004649074|nr:hypothetical protein [Ruminiclostridium josui]